MVQTTGLDCHISISTRKKNTKQAIEAALAYIDPSDAYAMGHHKMSDREKSRSSQMFWLCNYKIKGPK